MKTALLLFNICVMSLATAVLGQSTPVLLNPIVCDETGKGESLPEIRRHIQQLIALADFNKNAYANCQVATLRKRVGDSRAEDSFKDAICLDPEESAYELLYADYLRNFRGADVLCFPVRRSTTSAPSRNCGCGE